MNNSEAQWVFHHAKKCRRSLKNMLHNVGSIKISVVTHVFTNTRPALFREATVSTITGIE